ncbi:MAG: hypothetical protein ISP72_08780 [Flavobacteriaceae bacterium]|nr:hypothetical protein [Flavobacteriaceae bacterium]
MEEIIYQILYDFLVIRDTKVAYHGYSTLFLIYDLPETIKKNLIKLCENYTISDLSETAEDLTEIWMKKN